MLALPNITRCMIMLASDVTEEELRWLTEEKFPIWEACGADAKVLRDLAARTCGMLFKSGRARRLGVRVHRRGRQVPG